MDASQTNPNPETGGSDTMYSTEQVNKSNVDEIKEYHLKRLYQLSLKSTGKSIELDELTDEQKQWVKKHGF